MGTTYDLCPIHGWQIHDPVTGKCAECEQSEQKEAE